MRECKDHMKIRRINDFGPSFIDPYLFIYSLTVGAVAVTAGVIMKFNMSAIRTLADVDSEFPGFTVQDGLYSFYLNIRQVMFLREECIIRKFKHLTDAILYGRTT